MVIKSFFMESPMIDRMIFSVIIVEKFESLSDFFHNFLLYLTIS